MNRDLVVGVVGGAIAVGALGLGLVLGRAPAPATAPEPKVVEAPAAAIDRQEVEIIVRDYLMANPELIEEMQFALESRKEDAARVAAKAAIEGSKDAIFNASTDGLFGAADGDVTVVEFFDYNCGFCKRALTDMQEMVKADPKLKFVLKEFPILGPDSHKASIVSMAFKAQHPEKYPEFHQQLISGEGRATEDVAIRIALDLGADEAALRAEMRNPAIEKAFAETYQLANALAVTGTPSYVVGDEVVFGALGQEVLSEKVSNVRTCAKATC